MRGTIRTLTQETRHSLQQLIKKRCRSIAQNMGAKAEVKIIQGNPPMINHSGLFQVLKPSLSACLGESNVMEIQTPFLGGEDFAFYAEKIPGFYFILGCKDEKKKSNYPLHSSCFDLDEASLPVGAAALASCAMALLESEIDY